MSAVSEAPLPHGKRNASPGPSSQNKRRRVDTEAPASTNHPKSVLANLGLAIGTGNTLTQAKLKSVAGLLAPSANTPRGTSRAPKGKKPSPVAGSNPPSIASGTGTATDPVIISDEPPNQSLSAPTTARRTTRSQEAHMLLDTLPDDPSDVLTQTLRTILKNPTTVPRGRSSVSRDTAVYLANGRLTGTPFLRLLRHLASPARRTNPGLGLTLLKKLVESMRATEEASKPAQAGPSSAASTPMPVTPETPSTTLFATQDGSSLRCTNEKPFEPSLFPEVDFPTMGASASPLPTIIEADPIASTGFAIDPELLALSSNPGNTQNPNTSQNLESLEVDLAELFGALPPAGSDGTTLADVPVPMLPPLPIDTSIDWDALTDLPFEDLLATWNPENQCLPTASLPQAGPHPFPSSLPTVQQPTLSTPSIFDQAPKQQASSFGTVRIPPRAEALALLERAHARKKELEARLLATRRQLWGCRIEASVERNVLEALKKT